MSKQVNTADEQDEIQHMDYIYMVNAVSYTHLTLPTIA